MYRMRNGDTVDHAVELADAFAIPREMGAELEGFMATLTEAERDALSLLAAGMTPKSGHDFIGALPPEEVLNPYEQRVLGEELAREHEPRRSPSSRVVVVVKATRLCNLRCVYCRSWAEGPNQIMKFPVLVRAIRDVLSMQGAKEVELVWHGGEVTLLKPKFFKKMIWLQQYFRQEGQVVKNSLQTNATLLDEEWIEFLSSLDMGVGISIDGPPEVHDVRRLDADGKPTSHLVAEGIRRLEAAGIPHGALVVADRFLIEAGARRVLDYFAEIGLTYIDFLNIVPSNDPAVAPSREQGFVPFSEFVRFLMDCFDCWWADYRDVLKIDTFEDLVPALSGVRKPTSCYWAGYCMNSVVTLEANGDLAPCDKYIGDPGSIYGNIMDTTIADLIRQSTYLRDAQQERAASFASMKSCEWFHLCQGGCPHDRLVNRRHFGESTPSCCGLAPLLTHIRRHLAGDPIPTSASENGVAVDPRPRHASSGVG